jgi:hypothetical protein
MTATSNIVKTLLCLLFAMAITTAGVAAEEPDDDRMSEAWKDAIGDQEPILTEKQFALLNNLAFQAAASKVCDGFALNQDKFTKAMTDAVTPAPEGLSDDEADHWEGAVLMRFGTSYGLLLAEGNDEPEDFCESAKELKADSEVPNVWE